MLTQQFLSILTPVATTGNFSLQIQSDEPWDSNGVTTTLVLNVSSIQGTETAEQFAYLVYSQLYTFLSQNTALFQNTPPASNTATLAPFLAFPDQSLMPMWSPTWTEHVICVASQMNFDLTVTQNTIGVTTDIDWQPIPITLAEAKKIANAEGYIWEDAYGSDLTDDLITQKLKTSSSKLLGHLRNNIVLTTYLHYEIGNGCDSVWLKKKPVRNFYPPRIRKPSIYSTIQQLITFGTVKSNFECDRASGIIYYRFSQTLVENFEPFAIGNEIMIGYIAGYQKIPQVIKEHVVKLAQLVHDSEFSTMQGEGSRFNFKSVDDILRGWSAWLSEYYCS